MEELYSTCIHAKIHTYTYLVRYLVDTLEGRAVFMAIHTKQNNNEYIASWKEGGEGGKE